VLLFLQHLVDFVAHGLQAIPQTVLQLDHFAGLLLRQSLRKIPNLDERLFALVHVALAAALGEVFAEQRHLVLAFWMDADEHGLAIAQAKVPKSVHANYCIISAPTL